MRKIGKLTRDGLELRGELPYRQWREVGTQLGRVQAFFTKAQEAFDRMNAEGSTQAEREQFIVELKRGKEDLRRGLEAVGLEIGEHVLD